jgi:hypothetical protein
VVKNEEPIPEQIGKKKDSLTWCAQHAGESNKLMVNFFARLRKTYGTARKLV